MEIKKVEPMEKKLTDFPQHDKNPFMSDLIMTFPTRRKTRIVGQKPLGVHDGETGEVLPNTHLAQAIIERVDKEEFVKIFNRQLHILFDLSKRASTVLRYFINALPYNQDRVFFDINECKEYTRYNSKQTIYKGIGELVEAGCVARTNNSSLFYINPKVFFKGDRLDMINTWVVENSEEDKKLTEQIEKSKKLAEEKAQNQLDETLKQVDNNG